MTVVFDASTAILAADSARPAADAARELRVAILDREPIHAPALMAWEVGNVVLAKHPERFGRGLVDLVQVHREILMGIRLEGPGTAAPSEVGALCRAHGISYYDAAYLELAVRGPGGVLITEDRRLGGAGRAELGEARCLDAQRAWQAIQAGEL